MPSPSALKLWAELVAQVNGQTTFGDPGIRDPDNPCEAFRPGKPEGDCSTDGHYLCDECTERATCETGCGNRPMHCDCEDGPLAEYRSRS